MATKTVLIIKDDNILQKALTTSLKDEGKVREELKRKSQ